MCNFQTCHGDLRQPKHITRHVPPLGMDPLLLFNNYSIVAHLSTRIYITFSGSFIFHPHIHNVATMLRHLFFNILILVVLGLVLGACAASSGSTSASTTASGTTASTSTAAAVKYCPWCTNIPVAKNNTDCKLVFQMPENKTAILDYPVFVFNHDLTYLVKADMVSPMIGLPRGS